MFLDALCSDAVDQFWRQCGYKESFPRDLVGSVPIALPLPIVLVAPLTLSAIESWLMRRGVPFRFGCRSRAVRGCLITGYGQGIIFVDASDPPQERRFTVAHEVAHFLIDYIGVRDAATAQFGIGILGVLDGERAPKPSERVGAILTHIQIGIHTDLMEREELDGKSNDDVWTIEDRADTLALGLLAPPEEVMVAVGPLSQRFSDRQSEITRVLCSTFGLPDLIARAYAWKLLQSIGKGPSWVESLRLGRQ